MTFLQDDYVGQLAETMKVEFGNGAILLLVGLHGIDSLLIYDWIRGRLG